MTVTRIQFRRGTAAAWTAANPVLAQGEPGFEQDTRKWKMGDGTTPWVSLGYEADPAGSAAAAQAAAIADAADKYVPLTDVGSTVAQLVGGKIPSAQIPSLALVDAVPVADEAAMLALTSSQVQPGDVAVRADGAGSFLLTDIDPSQLANWILLRAPTDAVQSVNGHTGSVSLTASDVGADASGAAAAAQAYAIDRAHHTGTQTADTISDFDTAVEAVANATYVPLSIVSDSQPVNPKIGDLWAQPLPTFDPLSIGWDGAYWASMLALDDGDPVAQWDDQSANALHAVQADADRQPAFRRYAPSFNYRPAIQFTAANATKLASSSLAASVAQPGTLVVIGAIAITSVTMVDGILSNVRRLGRTGSTQWTMRSSLGTGLTSVAGTADAIPHLFLLEWNSPSGSNMQLDATADVMGPGDTGTGTFKAFTFGSTYDDQFPADGHLAFVGRLNRLMTSDEKADILAWSRAYYGTP